MIVVRIENLSNVLNSDGNNQESLHVIREYGVDLQFRCKSMDTTPISFSHHATSKSLSCLLGALAWFGGQDGVERFVV